MKSACILAAWLAALSFASAQVIQITAPTLAAQVPVGAPCSITWNADGLTGKTLTLTLNWANEHQTIADQLAAGSGHYQWDIPWDQPATNGCRLELKVEDEDGKTFSGPEFSLVANPSPSLVFRAPAGQEAWPRGATRTVSWEAYNLAGPVVLELLADSVVRDTLSGLTAGQRRCHYQMPAGLAPGTNYTLRLRSVNTPGLAALSQPFSVVATAPAVKPWTILIYMDGDNNLESGPLEDLADLGRLGRSSYLNVVAQMDRIPGYVTTFGNWYDTRRFCVTDGTTADPLWAAQRLGELDMASPDTLTDFINWAAENYPAQHYLLICADHGDDVQGLLEDWTPVGHRMTTPQFQAALAAADATMEIIGLDMCEQAYIDVAHQLRQSGAQYLLFSQYQEDRDWPYAAVFKQLDAQQGKMDSRALAVLLCDAAVAKYPTNQAATLTAVQLNRVGALTDRMAEFADAVLGDVNNHAAVQAAADAAAREVQNCVVYCARNNPTEYLVNGLNLFLPLSYNNSVPLYTPQQQAFAADGHWQQFLTNYYSRLADTWIGDARRQVAAAGGEQKVDLLRFLLALIPNTNRVWASFSMVGEGSLSPAGETSIAMAPGETIRIGAEPGISTNGPPIQYHFVRWRVSGNADVADIYAAQTTLRVNGSAAIIAWFCEDKPSYQVGFVAEGNGSFGTATASTFEVPAGGSITNFLAIPAPGYRFGGWGGDFPANANPLTLTNIQADMTIIGYFWPVPPQLTIQRHANGVRLDWPAVPPGFILEWADRLDPEAWSPVPNVTTNSLVLPASSTRQFFRLNWPDTGSEP